MKPQDTESAGADGARVRELAGGCSPLAKEILSYMARNPDAHDTLEGIVEWWLLEHRIRTRTAQVREALEQLVELGLLDRKVSSGRTRYRVNPRYHAGIRELGQKEAEP